MSVFANLGKNREDIDLSHLIFSAGKIGRLMTLATTPVVAGDSFEQNLVGSLRLSPLRRGLTMDSKVDVFTFYVPYRHIYGQQWIDLMKGGIDAAPITDVTDVTATGERVGFLGVNSASNLRTFLPKWLWQGYQNIFDNYFKVPHLDFGLNDLTWSEFVTDLENGDWGSVCAQLKTIWATPLPEMLPKLSTSIVGGTSIDLTELAQSFAEAHTEQERELFMVRYRDIISDFGGYANPDADQRPTLLMRNTFWASGYDVDGTGTDTLGQFSGRVMQSFQHEVPRFNVPEHGTIWTMALVRFPPTHTAENHYLTLQPLVEYDSYACDPAIAANAKPVVVLQHELFDSDPNIAMPLGQIAHSQWYRTSPDVVHPRYRDLQGFPFLNNLPSTNDGNQYYISPEEYEPMFQTNQLGHWNIQAKNNITVLRTMSTARESALINA